MGSLSDSQAYALAMKCYPWNDAIFVSSSLRLVAVFEKRRDFLRFLEFYTA